VAHSYHSFYLLLQYLRGFSISPGQSEAKLVGEAGRWRWGSGAGVLSLHSSCRVRPCASRWHYAGWSPSVSLGQILPRWVLSSLVVHGAAVGWTSAGHALNKALPRCDNSRWLLAPSSACHGGEGRGDGNNRRLQVHHLVVPTSLALSHSVRWWSGLLSGEILRWGVTSESVLDGEVNKCSSLSS
jgi:hypothetical protein